MSCLLPFKTPALNTFIFNCSPDVVFCGYTVPHPAETKMHFRIQTNGPSAVDVLQRGLKDLSEICDDLLEKFDV